MLVDPSGNVVPQNMLTMYKPRAQQKTVADGARQALAISAGLRQAIQQHPGLVGPLAGRSVQGMAKLGIGTGEAQKLLDDVSLLQSAAAKVHAGGRMSNEILKKVGAMLQPSFNPDQFSGALDSIDTVMGRYANEDKLVTVGEYRQQNQGQTGQPASTGPGRTPPPAHVVPAGAIPGRDAKVTSSVTNCRTERR